MFYIFGYVSGALTVVLSIVAAAFLLASAIGWCGGLRPVRSFQCWWRHADRAKRFGTLALISSATIKN